MALFATVSSAQIPSVFETGPALIWAMVAVFLAAALAIVGAALTARRHRTGRAVPRSHVRPLPPRRPPESQGPPLAA